MLIVFHDNRAVLKTESKDSVEETIKQSFPPILSSNLNYKILMQKKWYLVFKDRWSLSAG